MTFQRSKTVDSDKLFLLSHSDLEERLDPEYYRPPHFKDLEVLKNSSFYQLHR